MKQIQITPAELRSQAAEMASLRTEYENLFSNVTGVLHATNAAWSENLSHNFVGKITSTQKSCSSILATLQWGSDAAVKSAESFESIDSALASGLDSTAVTKLNASIEINGKEPSTWDKFKDELKNNYGPEAALAGSNYIKEIYSLIKSIKEGKSYEDWMKSGIKVAEFLSGAYGKLKNYLKIGNAVGTKKAVSWFVKYATGLKPLGRASSAKKIVTRFKKNLTNKTSPFHAQFQNVVDNFRGANGVKSAVASWMGVALTGVLNYKSNREEQAASNGTMSDGRVWAETITETIVDTTISYGAGIVVGAAVTTLSTVTLPGVAVVAAGGLIMAAANAGVKALTNKSTTEWVSDTILDAGTKISEGIGKGVKGIVKNVNNSVGGWFGKLAYAE